MQNLSIFVWIYGGELFTAGSDENLYQLIQRWTQLGVLMEMLL